MNDDDLIRRGDALNVLVSEIELARVALPQIVPILRADINAIAALPAALDVQPVRDPVQAGYDDMADRRMEPQPAPDVTALEMVRARRKFHDACNAYNAKWDKVQKRRAEGDWSLKLDEEYKAMEQSRRDFIGSAEAFADAAIAAWEVSHD